MDDLETWGRAHLAEDERVARAAGGEHWPDSAHEKRTSSLVHARRHDPARVLAEVDAKRRILDVHSPRRVDYFVDLWCQADKQEHPCQTVRLLLLPYADRPGYREEWRP